MTSRSETLRSLESFFSGDVLDIHGVAELLGVRRSSVNTLISTESKRFPEPLYELRGKNRHPLRLWWKPDVEAWAAGRPSSTSGKK
jgi:hypothetical protein